MAGDTASLTEKLLGDVETVIILSLGGGGDVWLVYFYGGRWDSVIILCNFRQECDPDTNFRDIDFRKNLMKALVDRDRELSWTNKQKHFEVTAGTLTSFTSKL